MRFVGISVVLPEVRHVDMVACRGVMAFRKWLTSLAGGGPQYAGPQPPEAWFSGLGRLRRRELLDRYSQHTLNCASCRQVPSCCQCCAESSPGFLATQLLAGNAAFRQKNMCACIC